MRIVSFLINYSKGTVLLAALAGVLSGAANTGLLAVINSALTSDDGSRIAMLGPFVALCVVVPLTRIVSELMLAHLGQRTIYDLRMKMSRKILAVPLRHLEQLGAARLMATLTDDIPAITNLVTVLPVLCINTAILIACLVYLGWLSWQFLASVALLIVVGAVSYQLPINRAMQYFRNAWRERDKLFNHLRALTEGTKELKLHSGRRKAFLDEMLHSTANAMRHANLTAQKIYTVASSWGQLLIFVIIGLVLFLLPDLPLGSADPKILIGFTLVLLYLMTPLQMLMNSLPGISRAEVALRQVEEMGLDLESHATESDYAAEIEDNSWERLELIAVTHVYRREGEDMDFRLGPIDLELRRGEVVFITGGNGSGKTTLAKVLVGLYPPEEGEVRLDDRAIGNENRESYRQHFSVVFSDFYLFETLLGLEAPGLDKRARQYLTKLRLDHKVQVTDGALSTTELSQGQRKRLSLLTAYLEDRPIYVFDEWAADQDPIFRDIFYLQLLPELKRRGKTAVVISHDDRYYHVGDRLVKLDYGQIVTELTPANPESIRAGDVNQPAESSPLNIES